MRLGGMWVQSCLVRESSPSRGFICAESNMRLSREAVHLSWSPRLGRRSMFSGRDRLLPEERGMIDTVQVAVLNGGMDETEIELRRQTFSRVVVSAAIQSFSCKTTHLETSKVVLRSGRSVI
jgi:hypothetical protein